MAEKVERLKKANCPDDCMNAVFKAEAAGIDFNTIMQLLQQYGPMIWDIIQKLFGSNANTEEGTAKASGAK